MRIHGAGGIDDITLSGETVTDAHLGKLPRNLKSLRLEGCTNVTAAGLRSHVGEMKQLGTISLLNGRHDDDALSFLGALPRLQHIDLEGNRATHTSARMFAQHPALRSLNLNDNPFGDTGMRILTDTAVAHGSSKLTSLDAMECDVHDVGALALAEHPTLTRINIAANHANDAGVRALLANPRLRALDVSANAFGMAVLRDVAGNTTLEHVGLRSVGLDDSEARVIATNTHLQSLDVSGNNICFDGARALARQPTLRALDIDENPIGNLGLEALSGAQLNTLHARSCGILRDGAIAFAMRNRTVQTLSLSFNEVDSEGIAAFARHPSVRHLEAICCNVDAPGAALIAQNPRLKSLDLSFNRLGNQGARALAAHPSMENLRLERTRIDASTLVYFAKNRALKRLDLSRNTIDRGLAAAFGTHPTMQYLALDDVGLPESEARDLAKNHRLLRISVAENGLSAEALQQLTKHRGDRNEWLMATRPLII
ncbi:leucine-rich repeat domain-containing protein [Robbsia andropogonis]|uniref:hypothetical protein n=1 Tax=Robbsia andropogonis TaxID=28092 RepID=UPI00046747C3|nr:hypothetical protein [Robbsia andropogonis]